MTENSLSFSLVEMHEATTCSERQENRHFVSNKTASQCKKIREIIVKKNFQMGDSGIETDLSSYLMSATEMDSDDNYYKLQSRAIVGR